MKGEDVEDFSNPNLVDSTFCKIYFPNFDSLRVQTLDDSADLLIQLGPGESPLRCLVWPLGFMQVRYARHLCMTGRHGAV